MESAGNDPVADAKKSGVIKGYRDFLLATLDDIQEVE